MEEDLKRIKEAIVVYIKNALDKNLINEADKGITALSALSK